MTGFYYANDRLKVMQIQVVWVVIFRRLLLINACTYAACKKEGKHATSRDYSRW